MGPEIVIAHDGLFRGAEQSLALPPDGPPRTLKRGPAVRFRKGGGVGWPRLMMQVIAREGVGVVWRGRLQRRICAQSLLLVSVSFLPSGDEVAVSYRVPRAVAA